jgi:DNA sulfur modification protein DndC
MAKSVEEIASEIQALFLSDSLPWIVGYSGGKDSTASLQLIWTAIAKLPQERRKFKPIYVISTDTLVENPVISAWVKKSLIQMDESARSQELTINPTPLTPALENRFWVNLIGKGYPAPRPKFRWCTDRLKISASTRFIQALSEANGEAILVLGTRRGESAARDKVMDQYEGSTRNHLSRNGDPKLSRVWVYAPIESWSSEDVWEYLIENDNPWGISNQELFNIYRGATPDAECPIVVDKSTPSCGDSRFGCYVCTMVTQDKSMAAMILNDESKSWMQPILDYRNNFLAFEGGDRHVRDFRRMTGKLKLDAGRLVHGPYTQKRREQLLDGLLRAQKEANKRAAAKNLGEIELISIEELQEIRRIWVDEKREIEDLLPNIYQNAMDQPFPGREIDTMPLDNDDLDLLREVAVTWVAEKLGDDPTKSAERASELYKLTRTLLAAGFQGLQSGKRSHQLDVLQDILATFAFTDEQDAFEFAKTYLRDAKPRNDVASETDIADTDVEEGTESDGDGGRSSTPQRKVIPIYSASSLG